MYLSNIKGPGSYGAKILYKYLIGDAIFNDSVSHFWKITEYIFNSQDLLGP